MLRAGVIAAALVVAGGGILYLVRHGPGAARPAGLPQRAGRVAQRRRDRGAAAAGHGRGIIQLGLLVLLATPVVRVALSIAIFARQRDRIYVLITLFVLAGLSWSLAGGFR